MKKLIFIVILIVMAICMVACNSTSSSDSTTTYLPLIKEEAVALRKPELSKEFVETALQFLHDYSTSSKELDNLASEIIHLSAGLEEKIYLYLNTQLSHGPGKDLHQFFGESDKIYSVDVWIHNYQAGDSVGCVSFNGQNAVYNYDHNPILLSAAVLGNTYPDNLALAEARIVAYVLLYMETGAVCIATDSEGASSYDFTFENELFKETARDILQSLR